MGVGIEERGLMILTLTSVNENLIKQNSSLMKETSTHLYLFIYFFQ